MSYNRRYGGRPKKYKIVWIDGKPYRKYFRSGKIFPHKRSGYRRRYN